MRKESQLDRRAFLGGIVGITGATQFWCSSAGAAAFATSGNPHLEGPGGFGPLARAVPSFPSPYQEKDYGALSIFQGLTGPDFTQINVMLPRDLKVHYRLLREDRAVEHRPARIRRFEQADSNWVSENLSFHDLELGVTYRLEVVDAETGELIDSRELRTLDLEKKHPRLVVLSCANDAFRQSVRDEMWESIAQSEPDLIVMIGDNIYGAPGNTTVTPDFLWSRYVEVRQMRMKLYHFRKLIPVIAVWDDHDYGSNDGDHSYEFKKEALAIFRGAYPQEVTPGVYEEGPGASSWFRAFGVHFQLMDGRFFKGLPGEGTQASQWGVEQEKWLFESLSTSKRPVLLFNGTLFFKTMMFCPSYEAEFEISFVDMMERLREISSPILFVSGDVHWSEISHVPERYLGYPTYEIVSSGLLSPRPPLSQYYLPPPNLRRLRGSFRNHFALIELNEASERSISVRVSAIKRKSRVQYSKELCIRI